MLNISSEVLDFAAEAAVIAKGGKLVYANNEAVAILGADCIGQSVKTLLGAEIAGTQASAFICDGVINDKRYTVRVSGVDNMRVIFFSRHSIETVPINDSFVYTVRSSLMNIGFAQDMCRDKVEKLNDESMNMCFDTLSRNCYRLNRVIQNTSVARGIANNDLPMRLERIEIVSLFRKMLEGVQLLRRDISFRFNGEGEIFASVDMAMLELMMLNLISNCLTHADNCTRISMNVMDCGDKVLISVDDDGCGIAPEQLRMAFGRYKYPFELTDMCHGMGLGMTVARGIAEKHGGALMLESKVGRGTTVRVSMKKDPVAFCGRLKTAAEPYSMDMKSIITGLSDCLPDESFTVRFQD